MLCLTLNQGDYMTIGSDVVIQMSRITGDRCKVVVHAPREVPIVRGEVLERDGAGRPDFIFDIRRRREAPKKPSAETEQQTTEVSPG